jgi:hypothetical protein
MIDRDDPRYISPLNLVLSVVVLGVCGRVAARVRPTGVGEFVAYGLGLAVGLFIVLLFRRFTHTYPFMV